jgi:RNA-directed DNA polymerase
MQLPPDLIERLDWDSAISTTISARGEFFPSRVEANAASQATAPLQRSLQARLRTGRLLGPAEVVYVPRRTIGTRPAFDVPFADRAVLSALALELARALEPYKDAFQFELSMDPPNEGAHQAYERKPLEHEDCRAILIGDVAAFYEYVDHRLLADEIVELTGDVDLSDAISAALEELVGRAFGLPQGPRGSDLLADFYLSQVDRRLVRRGISAYRYNDEFRLPVSQVEEARRLLVRLEGELRALGLVLNPAKTRIPARREYERQLEALEEALSEAREAAASDAVELDGFYGFDPDQFFEAELEELPTEQVEATFENALGRAQRDEFPGVGDRLIAQCLPSLAGTKSPVPLSHLTELVRGRPWLIRPLSLYLRGLMGSDHEQRTLRAISGLLRSSVYLHPWVRGWLIDALIHAERVLSPALLAEIRDSFVDSAAPWFLRGRAALVLATEKELPDQAAVAQVFDEAIQPARADIAAAVEVGEPEWREEFRQSLTGEDPLLRVIPDLLDERRFQEVV